MHLYLSTSTPWDTNFCNTEGQVIYKTESQLRFSLAARPITIKRILPSTVDPNAGDSKVEDALRDSFSDLAEIKYNFLATSRIRYNGIDMSTNEFFRQEGWSLFGKNRIFKGPDDKEYEWHLEHGGSKLYLKDDSTLVACYHLRGLGVIGDAHPASLEILEQGQHMVDLIVVTFVFVEKLRRDRQRNARLASAAS